MLARRGSGGIIGNDILTRFDIVFDLGRGRLYLRPNRRWGDPIIADTSGLHLIRRLDGTTLVDEVVAASPAVDAGLEPGDELRAIDGADIATMTLAVLRDRLSEPGRQFSFVIVRDGVTSTAVLRTVPDLREAG